MTMNVGFSHPALNFAGTRHESKIPGSGAWNDRSKSTTVVQVPLYDTVDDTIEIDRSGNKPGSKPKPPASGVSEVPGFEV